MTSLRTRFFRTPFGLTLAVAFVLAAAPAWADSVTYSASLPLTATNWNDTMSFPKFDLQSSCLDSVCFTLNGHVEGLAKFESLDGAPATVTMNLAATLTLQRPNNTPLVVTFPLVQTVDNVTAFDGVIDFGGTSGKTYPSLSGDKTEGRCTHTAEDLALFTGAGNIVLPVVATGASNGSGAGNLILQFNTSASAGADVTYYFHTCVVPTLPATWGAVKTLYQD